MNSRIHSGFWQVRIHAVREDCTDTLTPSDFSKQLRFLPSYSGREHDGTGSSGFFFVFFLSSCCLAFHVVLFLHAHTIFIVRVHRAIRCQGSGRWRGVNSPKFPKVGKCSLAGVGSLRDSNFDYMLTWHHTGSDVAHDSLHEPHNPDGTRPLD